MCIIAIKPKGKEMIPDENVRQMFDRNPHGAGIMYLKPDGKVHIEKGFFDVESVLDYLHQNEAAFKETDVVLHFRIATSGKLDALNCHPYSVWSANKSSCDVALGIAHNGMLDNYGWKGTTEINDTQVFIKDLRKLPHNFLNNTLIVNLLKKAIGTNKLVFLNKDGIHTMGEFLEDNGYYYSNQSYLVPKVWNYPSKTEKVKQTSLFSDEFITKVKKSYATVLDKIWEEDVGPKTFYTHKNYNDVMYYIKNTCRYEPVTDVYFDNEYCYVCDDDLLEIDRESLDLVDSNEDYLWN